MGAYIFAKTGMAPALSRWQVRGVIDMRSRRPVQTAVATARGAALLIVAIASASAATPPPDFTGVWTTAPSADGSGGRPETPTLPTMRPEIAKRVSAHKSLVDPGGETPGMYCLGQGMPGAMMGAGGYPMEFIQRPEQITVIYELHNEQRRIYFGERNAGQKDRVPGRNGYSSGRWEGETLVVETDNLVDQVDQRYPHSDQARIVERYSLDGNDAQGRRLLKVEMTMTDPVFYVAPVKTTRRWAQVPNGRLLPYDCNEEFWQARLEALATKAGVPLP